MSFSTGHKLAHYELIELIGRGGMGEVYRARDGKLDRDVAVKVLPAEFSDDRDRVARFEREAKLLASLNHPNIAAIYGLETSGETSFLVLELVPGETLAERMTRGPLALVDALDIAAQMVSAFEKAHEQGIVHRDLKPANVKVTPDGDVKILDFGLAKAFGPEDGSPTDASQSPTLTKGTALGVIMGTAAYMSPEQARGLTTDKRSDIWAFGVVLFEMLTGKPLFARDTVSDTLAEVLKMEPDAGSLPADTPDATRRLLRRCLQKDKKRRLPDIGVARLEIDDARTEKPKLPADTVTKPARPVTLGLAGIALVLMGVGVSSVLRGPAPSRPQPVMRLLLTLPEDHVLGVGFTRDLAIAPDGSRIAYVANQQIYVRKLDEETATPLAGTEGGASPFFSPDGEWIGFFQERHLKKISVTGGAPVRLADARFFTSGSWGRDDTIVYLDSGRIYRVSSTGGAPELLVEPPEYATHPQLLPDSSVLLYSETSDEGLTIVMHSLTTGEKRLVAHGARPRYVRTGHLLFTPEGSSDVHAVAFDRERLEVVGEARTVLSDVLGDEGPGELQLDISDSGTAVYVPRSGGGASTLVWVDREGQEEVLGLAPASYHFPALSPDGSRLAFSLGAQASDIWVYAPANRTLNRLTFGGNNRPPVWSPDGQSLVFASGVGVLGNLVRKAADGTGDAEPLTSGAAGEYPYVWTRDGKIVFAQLIAGRSLDLRVLDLETRSEPTTLLGTVHSETRATLSPDGRWIAYTSDESGRYEVYIRPFPDVESARWQVSFDGGHSPVWVRDTNEIVYRGSGKVMSVRVETESGIPTPLAAPKVLFDDVYVNDVGGRSYDVPPDGERFLMIKEESSEGGRGATFRIIVNWHEELERLVPVDGTD